MQRNRRNFLLTRQCCARQESRDRLGFARAVAFAIQLGLCIGLEGVAVAADPVYVRVVSPGTKVTAEDLDQFYARWMGTTQQRLDDYRDALKNRVPRVVWDLAYDARAMVQMYELTHREDYLKHLQAIGQITLFYRDDKYPGDAYPGETNPDCMKCNLPIFDKERGGVQAAWGAGDYVNYVSAGGLNPVDEVSSGIFAYPIVAFARLVAESNDPDIRTLYGDAAVRAANDGIKVFQTFAPAFRMIAGGVKEGTLYRPAVFPTPSQCDMAGVEAKDHLESYDYPAPDQRTPKNKADLKALIDKAVTTCKGRSEIANRPIAHNEAGSLMISFLELWRALDSDLYRGSGLAIGAAASVRDAIPLMVARNQRFFYNRLKLVIKEPYDSGPSNPEGARYVWNYLDYVPETLLDNVPEMHPEDTSHGNFDVVSIAEVRNSIDRINAITKPLGEPIMTDDTVLRRLANTFLRKIGLPSVVDRGGDLNCTVEGRAICPKTATTPWVYNSTTDGWVRLASVDPTVYRIVSDVVQRLSKREDFNGNLVEGLHDLTIANHAGLLANKLYSREVTYVDLSKKAGQSMPATGEPFGWVFAAQDYQNVTFRGTDRHIYELWRANDGTTGIGNLSWTAGAPRASGNPKAYEYPPAQTHNVVYRGTDGHLHVLWSKTGSVVVHEDLSRSAIGAPLPAGDPFPYVSTAPEYVQNVVYRGTDGHLHVLYWSDGAAVHVNLTAEASAPKAVGDPFGYFSSADGIQNVVYRGLDGHLHGVYWGLGLSGFFHEDLTMATGAPLPLPAGNPTAYVTATGFQNIVYLGVDGHIHGIYWTGKGAAAHDDLSHAVDGAPLPASDPKAYFSVEDGRHHFIYRTLNGHLHELSGTETSVVSHADLTTLTPFASPAADQPSVYVFPSDKTEHVVYRGELGHLYEISWKTPISDIIIILRPPPR